MDRYLVIFDVTKTHLLSRLKQSGTAALGVTFGIGMFITMVSFMTGLNGLLDGLVLNRTPHIHLYNEIKPSEKQPAAFHPAFADDWTIIHSIKPKANRLRIHNASTIMDYLREDERVRGVTPQVSARVFYIGGGVDLNGTVSGIDSYEENRLFNFGEYIIEGSADDLIRNQNGILLGIGVAQKLSLEVGDRVQVSTATGGVLPLKIVGFYQSGLAQIDDIQSFVNLKTAQQLLGESSAYITDINVKLHEMDLAGSMSKRLARQFNLTAVDIKTANAQFETGTTIRNLITYSVSITLLIVAGFGIYNILNMLIYEKMNDIAILKATGFSGDDVQLIFISQALIIGFIGGILGLLIGFGISVLISHTPFETEAMPSLKTYPVNFDPIYYVIGIVFAMLSTFLAGYLPSRKAKYIDPVDIIRGQ